MCEAHVKLLYDTVRESGYPDWCIQEMKGLNYMGVITISTETEETYSSISNIFIDYYMTEANGEFVKVYLYLLRLYHSKNDISVSDIADHFNLTEKDICRAIRYWVSVDVLKFKYNDKGDITGIILMNLKVPQKQEVHSSDILLSLGSSDEQEEPAASLETAALGGKIINNVFTNTIIKAPAKERHNAKALNSKLRDEEFYNIVKQAEAYCSKTITQTDTDTLLYIYDTLHFPIELIEYLLEYCASMGKTKFSYMEKTAINWYEAGITTREEAKAQSQAFINPLCRKVFKALGITSRMPTSIELTYIDSWQNDLGFDDSIILEACKRAVLSKPNSVNFAYINGILENWHKNNVHTFSDIEKVDQAFHLKISEQKKNQKNHRGVQKPNSFSTYQQSDSESELDEMTRLFINEVNNK